MMDSLVTLNPQDFVRFLKERQIRRFYFTFDAATGKVKTSHKELQPIAAFLEKDRRDFARHEGIFCQVTKEHDTLQAAFIHKTKRGLAQGGTRLWGYDTVEGFLRDGLRLSQGMTRKNALAGLWWGGGKGVIARNPSLDLQNPSIRQSLFREYGELTTSIKGCYVTAEDVGTKTEDMAEIFKKTRFITCIPPELGGSGNPSGATALGVVRGMEAACQYLFGSGLDGRTVAVQGMGNVGEYLIGFLFDHGVTSVIASDISQETVDRVKARFQGKPLEAFVRPRGDNSVLATECDVVAPCAVGAILNPSTIPTLRAKIVCGAANNQLEDPIRDDQALMDRKILYVPDFLVNRMGIVQCCDEMFGYVTHDPHIERHLDGKWEHSIYQTTMRVLGRSRETGVPPGRVAVELADQLSDELHPIVGHRGQLIIDGLVAQLLSDHKG